MRVSCTNDRQLHYFVQISVGNLFKLHIAVTFYLRASFLTNYIISYSSVRIHTTCAVWQKQNKKMILKVKCQSDDA